MSSLQMGRLHGETFHGSMEELMEILKKMNSTLSPSRVSQMINRLEGILGMMMTEMMGQEGPIQGVCSKILSGCMDPRGRGREQHQDSNRYQGGDRREAPRHRTREAINDIPSHGWPFEEQRALRQLWQAKGEKNWLDCSAKETRNPHHEYSELKMFIEGNQFKSEAIMISPMEDMFSHQPQQISIDQGLVQHPPSTNQGAQQANQVSKDL
jgi:hypothetical protein